MQAIVLAGGRGSRLKPYTTVFPKPLMPVGPKPILEIIIQQLGANGFSDITLAVGYLNHMIEAYFQDGEKYGVRIDYSLEEKALGTAGPIGLMKDQLHEDFIVMNGDLLTNISYQNLMNFHLNSDADATIAVHKRSVAIDYGVLEFGMDNMLRKYREKPKLDYQVSMGINVFKRDTISSFINANEFLDIPDLMRSLVAKGKKVLCYEEDCEWLDIGRIDDYQDAVDIFESNPGKFLPGSAE